MVTKNNGIMNDYFLFLGTFLYSSNCIKYIKKEFKVAKQKSNIILKKINKVNITNSS